MYGRKEFGGILVITASCICMKVLVTVFLTLGVLNKVECLGNKTMTIGRSCFYVTCHCLLTVLSWTCTTKLVPYCAEEGPPATLSLPDWSSDSIGTAWWLTEMCCYLSKEFSWHCVTGILLVSLDLRPCCVEFEFLSSLFSFLNNSVTHKTSRAMCFIAYLLTGTITYIREQHLHELQHNNWKINR